MSQGLGPVEKERWLRDDLLILAPIVQEIFANLVCSLLLISDNIGQAVLALLDASLLLNMMRLS